MKYHKFFFQTEEAADEFVSTIQGDFQYIILPRFSTPEEGQEAVMLGFMLDVCGKDWQADMANEVRPTTHEHWFAGMEEVYYNSIGGHQ